MFCMQSEFYFLFLDSFYHINLVNIWLINLFFKTIFRFCDSNWASSIRGWYFTLLQKWWENAGNFIWHYQGLWMDFRAEGDWDKSAIYGVNIKSQKVSQIAKMLNCKVESLPIMYLGLPLGETEINRILEPS